MDRFLTSSETDNCEFKDEKHTVDEGDKSFH